MTGRNFTESDHDETLTPGHDAGRGVSSIVNGDLFPTRTLPEPLSTFIETAARAMNCDAAYFGLPLLAGLASAIGNSRRLSIKSSWSEPAILWTCIIGESGTVKSPAQELALEPVKTRQREAMRDHRLAVEEHNRASMLYERDLAKWKRSKSDEPPPDEPARPVCYRTWSDDATIEAVAGLLQDQPRGLLLARDELAGWLGSFNRYAAGGKGADAERWLELYGGRSMAVDRRGSGVTYVPMASASITGTIQPGALRRALGVEYMQNGLAARLLMAHPPRQAKRWTAQDVSADLRHQVAEVFAGLYALDMRSDEHGDPSPTLVSFTPDAARRWATYYNAHNTDHLDLSGHLAAASSKLEAVAARLSLIIHYARVVTADDTLDDPFKVDAASLEAAISLKDWFQREAYRVYTMLAETEEQTTRRELAELIRARGGSVSPRDLMRCRHRFQRADDAVEALDELQAAGVGEWVYPTPGPQGGRPSRVFKITPPLTIDQTPDDDAPAVVSDSASVEVEPY